MTSLADEVAAVEKQLNEVRGPNNLRTRFLQALQRLDADCVRGVELGEIKLKGLECGAYPEQVRDLLIGEASGYSHDMPSSLIRDVNPAFHGSSRSTATDAPSKIPHRSLRATACHEIW